MRSESVSSWPRSVYAYVFSPSGLASAWSFPIPCAAVSQVHVVVTRWAPSRSTRERGRPSASYAHVVARPSA
ncbi:hypothetical protein NQZ70_01450 [Sorangium sp. Soce836]|nr:hypothetical protein NQZ70_01450 [Sorangium sp. Soce836]